MLKHVVVVVLGMAGLLDVTQIQGISYVGMVQIRRRVYVVTEFFNDNIIWPYFKRFFMKTKSFLRNIYFVLLLLCAVTLSGCATVKSSVQTYYKENLNLSGKSFAFYPIKKFNQSDSLAFDYYSQKIAGYLNAYGMHQTSIKSAKVIVKFRYYIVDKGVSEATTSGAVTNLGKSQVFSMETKYYPLYGRVRKGDRFYHYCFLMSLYYKNSLQHGNKKPIYQVILTSLRKKRQPMADILPYMIKSLFKGFPGANGTVRYVRVLAHGKA